ncbi:hemolytic protein HlpA [Calothrix sp. 336/3]|uniref:hemolytic protein HlpA n=1 Tax=Calothrix sp. 336/3 TaxID=1337936 RepID=UPI0004E3FF71|nr:hemolytic protein HlpA [Calothrix sp. 336/3]AKG21135.1 hemolytic protein HlpA-like protein [Calothrix sp. 336/3]
MKTPVVFVIFKRPHTTAKVLDAIRQAKPEKLFVVADGPRSDRPDEPEKCAATRAIIDQVDWDCEVMKHYSDTNLGCATRLPSGLDWVFEQVEEAIIIEDDCVPHPTFFPFCEELLERYRDDSRVGLIAAQNGFLERKKTDYSYYFSRYNGSWGWATWKRSWQNYDQYMKLWPEFKAQGCLNNIFPDFWTVKYWSDIFDEMYSNPCGYTWDYQWTFACFLQSYLTVIPNVNLVSNIGFGADSTHFLDRQDNPYENQPTEMMEFPLKHPPFIIADSQADRFQQRHVYDGGKPIDMVKRDIKKIISKRLQKVLIKTENSIHK